MRPVELAAWRGMLRTTHCLRGELGVELSWQHGLSMADYDALVALIDQPGRAMRMTALAETILQPRSSLTRIVTSLESRGLVRRESTPGDARGATAALTGHGALVFAAAHRTHLAGVRARFLDRLDEGQLEQLVAAWAAIDPDSLDGGSR